jgi:hypothetical protein
MFASSRRVYFTPAGWVLLLPSPDLSSAPPIQICEEVEDKTQPTKGKKNEVANEFDQKAATREITKENPNDC